MTDIVDRYLDIFERVASRARPKLKGRALDIVAGTWLRCSAVKVYRRPWVEETIASNSEAIGIFLSVWVEEKGLKCQRRVGSRLILAGRKSLFYSWIFFRA